MASSSSSMDGGRRAWKLLWSTPVPQKINFFAWKLATEGLATMQNRMRRNLESDSTCRLCGTGEEDVIMQWLHAQSRELFVMSLERIGS